MNSAACVASGKYYVGRYSISFTTGSGSSSGNNCPSPVTTNANTGLAIGAIIGIVVGAIIILLIFVCLIFYWFCGVLLPPFVAVALLLVLVCLETKVLLFMLHLSQKLSLLVIIIVNGVHNSNFDPSFYYPFSY